MLTVVKIGGGVLENVEQCSRFLDSFCAIGGKKLLVHGGGRTSSALMKKLGIQPVLIDGRRVTNAATLEIVSMVYSGLNKQIVAQLQSRKCNAVGLCGADENVLTAVKRPSQPVDFGLVGDVSASLVNSAVLWGYMDHGITPILAPLTHDGMGNLLNTNADTIASVVAQALQSYGHVRLIYAFEKPGLLADSNDNSSVISEFSKSDFAGSTYDIHSGMIPKLNNGFDALDNGVAEVYICKTNEIVDLAVKTKLLL